MNTPLYETASLAGDDLSQAIPLLQVTWPKADRQVWHEYVRFLNDRAKGNAGVIALRNGAGYICGLLVYELDRDPLDGVVFTVHVFTAVDLADSLDPVRALIETATAQAAGAGCRGVQIRLYNEQLRLGARLRTLGLTDRAGFLWKSLS